MAPPSLPQRVLLLTTKGIRLFTTPPYVKGWLSRTCDTEAKVVAESEEVSAVEQLGEDVCDVVAGPDSSNFEFPLVDHIVNVVEFHPNVLHMGVKNVVFCEVGGGVVVAMKGGRGGCREAEAI